MIKIIKEEILNTGGNCMVEFMTVVGIGDTTAIGFSSDCFVGYNCSTEDLLFDGTQELWVANSNQQLRDLLGVVNAGVILQQHKLGEYLMNNLSNEKLRLIVAYNEVILEKADGDQGSAVGLITLYDEETDTIVYDPFYDTSFRCAVEPIEAYGQKALLSMIAEWELLGGNQRKRIEI